MRRVRDNSIGTDTGRIREAAVVIALALGSVVGLWTPPARAATDSEGIEGTGQNDTSATAQSLGVLSDGGTLIARGWISLSDPNDVDFYTFQLPGSLGIYLDIDLAEDVGVGSDLDVGLDSEIAVFDSLDRLLAHNDDSDFFVIGEANAGTDPGSDPFADHDPFLGTLFFGAGTFTVAVSYFDNSANALDQPLLSAVSLSQSGLAISGVTPDSSYDLDATCDDPADPAQQCAGAYTLYIRTTFLPEATTALGSAAACLTLAMLRRRG